MSAIRKLCWNNTSGLIADSPAQNTTASMPIFSAYGSTYSARTTEGCSQQDPLRQRPRSHLNRPRSGMTKATYYFRFYLARRSSMRVWEINIESA